MPFRTGAFQTAAQAQLAVVPVALRGVRSVLRDGTWYLRRAPIRVTSARRSPRRQRLERGLGLRDRVRAEMLKNCGEPDLFRLDPANFPSTQVDGSPPSADVARVDAQ